MLSPDKNTIFIIYTKRFFTSISFCIQFIEYIHITFKNRFTSVDDNLDNNYHFVQINKRKREDISADNKRRITLTLNRPDREIALTREIILLFI